MKTLIALAAALCIISAPPALAGKKAQQDSVSFDPLSYSCASFLKLIDAQGKGGEEEAGVAVMWAYGFLSGLDYAMNREKPTPLNDRAIAVLIIDYASICNKKPDMSFFEATIKMAGQSDKPVPPAPQSPPEMLVPVDPGAKSGGK